MKVTFIDPKAGFPGWSFGWLNRVPLLGQAYLGTILKNNGHEVELLKESVKRVKVASLEDSDVVIHSITTNGNYELIKKSCSNLYYYYNFIKDELKTNEELLYEPIHLTKWIDFYEKFEYLKIIYLLIINISTTTPIIIIIAITNINSNKPEFDSPF